MLVSLKREMNPSNLNLWFFIAYVAGFVFVLRVLWVILLRERVKTSLKDQGFHPKRVRWRPFAFWASAYGTGFVVVYLDDYGIQHRARCSVFDKVHWVPEEVDYLDKNLPLFGRILYLCIAAVLLYIAARAALATLVFLPPTLRAPRGIRISGWAKQLVALAAFSGAASLLIHVVYSYVRRNDRFFRRAARSLAILGWVLFFGSFVVYAYTYRR